MLILLIEILTLIATLAYLCRLTLEVYSESDTLSK